MKIIEGLKMRTLGTDHIVIAEGEKLINFGKMIALNSSAAYLWENIEGKEFTIDTLADLLVEKYGIDASLAKKDSEAVVTKWREAGIVEE